MIDLLREEPLCSSDIADELDMSRPATSRHLRVLRKSGLVSEQVDEDDARIRMYRLRRDPFVELSEWVEEVSAFWDDQLAAFKAHAQRKAKKR